MVRNAPYSLRVLTAGGKESSAGGRRKGYGRQAQGLSARAGYESGRQAGEAAEIRQGYGRRQG